MSPVGQLAQFGPRALGIIIDAVPAIVIGIVGYILIFVLGHIFFVLGILAWLAMMVASLGYWVIQMMKQGATGQTVGQKVAGVKLLKEQTGQPVGAGFAIGRSLVHWALSLPSVIIIGVVVPILDYLFPLWDSKKQTLADKIMSTVVVVVPKQPFDMKDVYTTS